MSEYVPAGIRVFVFAPTVTVVPSFATLSVELAIISGLPSTGTCKKSVVLPDRL